MLTTIREKAQGFFAWIILIGITIPFALWGIQNYLEGGQEKSLLTVGDHEFTRNEISQAINQYRAGLGQSNAMSEAQIKQQAINKLIQDEALLQHVKAQKLAVSDASARAFIKSLPYFQVDGAFDKQRYEGLLKAQGMTSAAFVARIKKALTMQQYQEALVNTAMATDYDLSQFYALQNQTRNFGYIVLSAPSDLPEPGDEQIQSYYQAHQAQFQHPETLTVEYIELSRQQLAETIEIDDETLETQYQQKKAQFSEPERRKISHILIASNDQRTDDQALALAKTIKAELAEKSFAELAKKYSDDPGSAVSGGDLGWMEKGLFVPEFEQAAENLSPGDVSEPVKTQFGYHLITVTESQPEKEKTFAEVKSELARQYRQARAENLYFQKLEKLSELSYEHPDSLSFVAEQLQLSLKTSEPFTRDQGQGPAAEEAFRKAAFSEIVMGGENSEPIEARPGLAWVVRKKTYQPAELKPLPAVREQVINRLKQEQADQALMETLDQLKKRLGEGAELAQLAEQANVEFQQVEGLTRTSTEVPAALLDAVFTAPKPTDGKISLATAKLPDNKMALIALTQVTPGQPTEEDKARAEAMKQTLAMANGQTQFSAALTWIKANLAIKPSKALDTL